MNSNLDGTTFRTSKRVQRAGRLVSGAMLVIVAIAALGSCSRQAKTDTPLDQSKDSTGAAQNATSRLPASGNAECPEQDVCSAHSVCEPSRICFYGCCATPSRAVFATDASPISPIGHEFLTVAGAERAFADLASATAGAPALCRRYGTSNLTVCGAILGNRWSDLMGFRAGPAFPSQQACLNAVAQDANDVQADHFLRTRSQQGADGRTAAIAAATARFSSLFITAAVAGEEFISVADGGAVQDHLKVERAPFLLGRALHLLQDSFSLAHAFRSPSDNPPYSKARDIRSYVCTSGAPPHVHSKHSLTDLFVTNYADEDVIWATMDKKIPEERLITLLKPNYQAAVDASADAWKAFLRVRKAEPSARADLAKAEANALVAKWFTVAETGLSERDNNPGSDCPSEATVERYRTWCLDQTGRQVGDQTRPPFDWNKKSFERLPKFE